MTMPVAAAALALIVVAAVIITARSYGPRDARRSWGGGWRWLATQGAAEALLAGVVISALLVVTDALTR